MAAADIHRTAHYGVGLLSMGRWALYVLGLAAFVGMNGAALGGEFRGRWIAFAICLAIVVVVAEIERRRLQQESQQPDYRRRFEAPFVATFSTLYGAVIDLGYDVTARNRASGTLDFKPGSRDLLIPRPSVDWTATVRRVGDRESEIVLVSHADQTVRGGYGHRTQRAIGGLSIFPEGPERAAKRILDRVDATLITFPFIDAARADPGRPSAL